MNLYGGQNSGATEDQKVAMMRKDIDIELVHDQHNEEITAFKINYSAHNAHLAQQVTSALTDLFITENLKVRQRNPKAQPSLSRTSWRKHGHRFRNRKK